MFNPVLNFSASTYEAIIAAFVVLSFIASGVIVSKGRSVEWLRGELDRTNERLVEIRNDAKKVTASAAKALMSMMTGSLTALAKIELRAKSAEARADAAEAEITAIMQAAADRDDELADRATGDGRHNPFTGDPTAFFFGDSHFAQEPGRNNPDDLSRLFAMLDGKGRNGAALDDLIFGRGNRPNVRVVQGGDFIHGSPHGDDVNVGDVLAAISGDPSSLEQKVGARCIGLKVMRADGSEITGPELDDVIASLGGARPADFGARPSFDIDPATFGTQVHEEIERSLNERGAHGTVESMTGPDESCSTQQPHNYGTSSPRAG